MSEKCVEMLEQVVNLHRTDDELKGFLTVTLDEIAYDFCKAHLARCEQCQTRTTDLAEIAMPLDHIKVTSEELARGRAITEHLAITTFGNKVDETSASATSPQPKPELTVLKFGGWELPFAFGLEGAMVSTSVKPKGWKILEGLLDLTVYHEGNNLAVRVRSYDLSLNKTTISFEVGKDESLLNRPITLEANAAETFVQGILHFTEEERRKYKKNELLRMIVVTLPKV